MKDGQEMLLREEKKKEGQEVQGKFVDENR